MAPYAREDLENKQKKLNSIGKKQEKTARYFEATTLRLVGNYIIFQAIIFLAVSNHGNLSCKYWWIPFCLSSLIAVVFAITFKTLITNWERTRSHYDKNFLQRDWINHQIVLFPIRESKELSSDQLKLHVHQEQPEILQCDTVKLYQRSAFIYLVSVALLVYTIIILKACRSILCHNL